MTEERTAYGIHSDLMREANEALQRILLLNTIPGVNVRVSALYDQGQRLPIIVLEGLSVTEKGRIRVT